MLIQYRKDEWYEIYIFFIRLNTTILYVVLGERDLTGYKSHYY
jgi:hypothetical protein